MAVADGTNCITQAEDILRDMLANTAAFRTWVGAADVTEAESEIYFHFVPKVAEEETHSQAEWEAEGNYAKVYTAPEEGFSFDYAAAPNEFLATSGRLVLELVQWFASTSIDDQEDTRTALNAIGGIIQDMLPLAGTAGYFSINRVSLASADWEPEDQQPATGRQFRVVAVVEWSVGNEGGE